ncbi:hypothetical protein C8J56DRAFT_896545 [Mycena floridula]|nr:hypothetical protein C8J56DRAFT_896545 [Mycena floridula]
MLRSRLLETPLKHLSTRPSGMGLIALSEEGFAQLQEEGFNDVMYPEWKMPRHCAAVSQIVYRQVQFNYSHQYFIKGFTGTDIPGASERFDDQYHIDLVVAPTFGLCLELKLTEYWFSTAQEEHL